MTKAQKEKIKKIVYQDLCGMVEFTKNLAVITLDGGKNTIEGDDYKLLKEVLKERVKRKNKSIGG